MQVENTSEPNRTLKLEHRVKLGPPRLMKSADSLISITNILTAGTSTTIPFIIPIAMVSELARKNVIFLCVVSFYSCFNKQYCLLMSLIAESHWGSLQIFNFNSPFSIIKKESSDPLGYHWVARQRSNTANPICQIDMNDCKHVRRVHFFHVNIFWLYILGCPLYFRGSCYQIYTVPKNHDEANAACQQNGWHLAAITSIDEHHFIMGQTQQLSGE